MKKLSQMVPSLYVLTSIGALALPRASSAAALCTIVSNPCYCTTSNGFFTVRPEVDTGYISVVVGGNTAKNFAYNCEYQGRDPQCLNLGTTWTDARQSAVNLGNTLVSNQVCGYVVDDTTPN